MKTELDTLLSGLRVTDTPAPTQPARMVRSQEGTTRADGSLTANSGSAQEFNVYSQRMDALFEDKPAYQAVKHEKPEHRLMLWLSLQGHSPMEIARVTGYTPEHVRTIRKQPWFRDSFCRLSTEMGKDVVETFLEGEVVPTLQVLVSLRDTSESDAVRKSACDAILDRIRGKPTVKIESKSTGTIEHIVGDATRLLEEQRRLDEQISANGIRINGLS